MLARCYGLLDLVVDGYYFLWTVNQPVWMHFGHYLSNTDHGAFACCGNCMCFLVSLLCFIRSSRSIDLVLSCAPFNSSQVAASSLAFLTCIQFTDTTRAKMWIHCLQSAHFYYYRVIAHSYTYESCSSQDEFPDEKRLIYRHALLHT